MAREASGTVVRSAEKRRVLRATPRTFAVLLLSLGTLVACRDSRTPFEVPTNPGIPAGPEFPRLDRPGRIFHEPPGLYAWAGAMSRIVIFDDGELVVQFIGGRGQREYRGRYSTVGDRLDVDFGNLQNSWLATIHLHERGLTIHYNLYMMASDFEDAEYRH